MRHVTHKFMFLLDLCDSSLANLKSLPVSVRNKERGECSSGCWHHEAGEGWEADLQTRLLWKVLLRVR